MQQNLELQPQELKPSKNGNAIVKALRSQLIRHSHDADISIMLKYIMIKVGLRAANIPDGVEKDILIDHIRKNYPNNTIDEMRLAFEMAINEDLDIDPDEIKCYENFSCSYFSRIMNAYLSFAAKELKLIRQEPPPQRIYTDEEIDNLHRQWTEEFYQHMRNGYSGEIPPYVYPILLKDGLIKEGESCVAFFAQKLGKQKQNIYVYQKG